MDDETYTAGPHTCWRAGFRLPMSSAAPHHPAQGGANQALPGEHGHRSSFLLVTDP